MKNLKKISGAAEAVISALIVLSDERKATKFVGPHLVIKATRQRRTRKNAAHQTFLLTVGAPNYAERKFIKQLIKVKEPFPVKKICTNPFPVPRTTEQQRLRKKAKARRIRRRIRRELDAA